MIPHSIQKQVCRRPVAVAGLLLTGITLALYWPVGGHEFINFDDHEYIIDNPHVRGGLTWPGVVWALGANYASNWHPLTWISHMLDCQLFGLHAGGHHLANLLLHVVNSLLLFWWLRMATGAIWRSALVAALFAWHPLHVESVAWAAERKDVLSTLFFLLTLLSYSRYALSNRRGALGRDRPLFNLPCPSRWYALTLFCFALGLMSKPMLVTLPFVLLLLDFWPLNRLTGSAGQSKAANLAALLVEKIPFFLFSLGSSVVTFVVQKSGGAVWSVEELSFSSRLANAVVSYGRYLGKTVWPSDLAVVYPYVTHWPVGLVVLSSLLLVVGSLLCLRGARGYPFLPVGWFWFLGTLVPVIGLVQVGAQAMADRYMYIPSIGLFVLLVWGSWELGRALRVRPAFLAGASALAATGCLLLTARVLPCWENDRSLFSRALEVTGENYIAYDHLGNGCMADGQTEAAIAYYQASLRLRPRYARAYYHIGTLLMESGRLDEAIPHFRAAVTNNPGFARAYCNLGKALLAQGHAEEARVQLRQAVKLDPDFADARYNLGSALLLGSEPAEAAKWLAEAARLDPGNASARMNLAVALMTLGRPQEALPHFAEGVRLAPGNPELRFNYGLALLEQNRGEEAAAQFAWGARLRPEDARMHYRLGLALVGQSKLTEAATEFRETLRLAPDFPEARDQLAGLLAPEPTPAAGF